MKKTWNYVCVVKPNDKTSDTNDDVTTKDQHSAHEMRHLTSEGARSLLFSFVQSFVVIFAHCTSHRVAQGSACFALMSSMHAVSVTLRLRALHSIQLLLLLILFQSGVFTQASEIALEPLLSAPLCPAQGRR